MKIAVVVGHDKTEQGAYSHLLKQSEFAYNSIVAELIGYDTYFRNEKLSGYTAKIKDLANRINAKQYDLVIELHFNAANGIANGVEALCYEGSIKGQKYAQQYVSTMVKEYKSNDRGVKKRIETDRGGLFLKLVNAPALILEPFFGDNKESLNFKCHSQYAEVIKKCFVV